MAQRATGWRQVVGPAGLLAALAALQGVESAGNVVTATPEDKKLLDEYKDCFVHGFQWQPDIAGTMTTTSNMAECQALCAHNISGCAHFGYWPTSGECWFGDFTSHLIKSSTGAIAGFGVCPTGENGAWKKACSSSDVPQTNAFPGRTPMESNLAWPSGRQPMSLECWPMGFTGGYVSCSATAVSDTRTGWPGKCYGLLQQDLFNATTCAEECKANPLCASYQVTGDGACYQGVGEDCSADRPDYKPVVAERFQHGNIRVLWDLKGWQIVGLFRKFVFTYRNVTEVQDEITECKLSCYADIRCQYWQFTPTYGCWVEDQSEGMSPGYPLTLDFAYNNTPFARDVVAGEFIQHVCPLSETTVYPTQAPMLDACMEVGIRYKPNLVGIMSSVEESVSHCKAKCADMISCEHFAYWPDKACFLQGKDATPVTAEDSQVIAGIPKCAANETAVAFGGGAASALNGDGVDSAVPNGNVSANAFDEPNVTITQPPPPPPAPEFIVPAPGDGKFVQVQATIQGMDYDAVTQEDRGTLEKQYLNVFATAMGVDTALMSEEPGGQRNTVSVASGPASAGRSTVITAYVPHFKNSTQTVKFSEALHTKEFTVQLAHATACCVSAEHLAGFKVTDQDARLIDAVELQSPLSYWLSGWRLAVVAGIVVLCAVGLCTVYNRGDKRAFSRKSRSEKRSAENPRTRGVMVEEGTEEVALMPIDPELEQGAAFETPQPAQMLAREVYVERVAMPPQQQVYMPGAVSMAQAAVGAAAIPGAPPPTLALAPEVYYNIDRNGDGRITREEWQRHAFSAFDQDGDGVISREEFIRGLSPPTSPLGSAPSPSSYTYYSSQSPSSSSPGGYAPLVPGFSSAVPPSEPVAFAARLR